MLISKFGVVAAQGLKYGALYSLLTKIGVVAVQGQKCEAPSEIRTHYQSVPNIAL